MCPMSHAMRHLLHVRCQVSGVFFFFRQSGGASRLRVSQRGLACLVFFSFYHLIIIPELPPQFSVLWRKKTNNLNKHSRLSAQDFADFAPNFQICTYKLKHSCFWPYIYVCNFFLILLKCTFCIIYFRSNWKLTARIYWNWPGATDQPALSPSPTPILLTLFYHLYPLKLVNPTPAIPVFL